MGGFYPKNPNLGQTIQTNVDGIVADMVFGAKVTFSAAQAVVAATAGVLVAINAGIAQVVHTTDFIALPCAKNITATAGGTATDIKAVQVIIEGLDIAGNVITETLPAFTVDTAGTVVGSKAFASVTKLTIPAMDGAGVTIALGYGEKLGLPFLLPTNTCLMGVKDETKEGTAPTVTTSKTALSGNTIDFNSPLDGTAMHAYFMV